MRAPYAKGATVKVDAVVLAGGDGAVIDPNSRFKGLLPVAGKPMVEWVVDALRLARGVAEIAVVVPSAEDLGAWVDKVDKLVVSDASFVENTLAGIGAFRVDRPVLVATGDLPAITPEAIDDFIERSLEVGADFTYPLISKADMLSQFPGSDRSFISLSEGEYTGGNMMIVNPRLVQQNRDIGQRLFETRKSALRMARTIGLRFAVKLALGRLQIYEVEAKMGEILGGSGAAIRTPYASIGADVDKPIDVIVAERVLYAKSGRRGKKNTE